MSIKVGSVPEKVIRPRSFLASAYPQIDLYES